MISRNKYSLVVLYIIFALSAMKNTATGQAVDKVASAEANVLTDITLEGTQDLEYATVLQNSQKYIDVVDGTVKLPMSNGVSGGESRGYFTITGTVGTKMDIVIEFPRALTPVNTQNNDAFIQYYPTNSEANLFWNRFFGNGRTSSSNESGYNNIGVQAIIVDEDPSITTELNNAIIPGGNGVFGDATQGNSQLNLTHTFSDIVIPGDPGEREIYVVIGGLIGSGFATELDAYTADITLTTTIISD